MRSNQCSRFCFPFLRIGGQSIACLVAGSLVLVGCVSSKNLLGEGLRANRDQKDQEAIRLLTHAIQSRNLQDRELGKAYHFRGISYSRSGLHEKADQDFVAAIHLQPKNGEIYFSKGNNNNRRGRNEDAIEDLNRAIQLSSYSRAYALRGKIFLNRNEIHAGIQDLTKAIQIGPPEDYFFYYRGVGFIKEGNYPLALKDFDKAIQLSPASDISYYDARGNVHYHLGNNKLAVQDFTEVLRQNPHEVDALFGRAASYAALGNPEKEREDLSKILNLDPRNSRAYFNRAGSNLRNKNFSKALMDLEQAVKYEPELTASADFIRGVIAFLHEDYRHAEKAFEQSLHSAPVENVGRETPLWLYLVQRRLGKQGEMILEESVSTDSRGQWIDSVSSLLTGAASAESLLTQVTRNKSLSEYYQQVRRCEVYFYSGEMLLLNREEADAMEQFHSAIATRAYTAVEYTAAQVELQRLEQQQRDEVSGKTQEMNYAVVDAVGWK